MRTVLGAVRAALLFVGCAISPSAIAQQSPADPLAQGAPRPPSRDERAERRASLAVGRCLLAARNVPTSARRRAVVELRVGAGRAAVTAVRLEIARRSEYCAGTIEACRDSPPESEELRAPSVRACVARAALSAAAAIKRGPVRSLTWRISR